MNAISPFSLIDKLVSGKAAGAVAGFAADTARQATRPGGPLGNGFSDIWNKLDANDDGRVTGRDALGHAVMAGAWAVDTVGKAMGLEMDRGTSSDRSMVRSPADGLATPAQMMLAGSGRGDGASSSQGAVPATDLPAFDAIRSAYQAMRAARL